MTFEPLNFITGPFTQCPACGGAEYGTLSVSNNRHSRRCRECWHTATHSLPAVHKKLVYLDQMVLSNMAKELDPDWRSRTSRKDPFWAELYDQVERLVKLQVLTCPQSPIHEKEASYDDRVEGVLRTLGEHLAAGVSFDFPEEIRGLQTWVAQRAVINGEQLDWASINRRDVTDGPLDQWMDRISIRANMGHLNTAEVRRAQRNALGQTLEEIWKRFQDEKLDFDTVFQRELRAFPDAAVESLRRDLQLRADMYAGRAVDPLDLYPNALSRTLRNVERRFEEAAISADDPMKQAIEFLYSDAALNTPQNRLNAMLYAALARRATRGQKRVPNRGTPNDIDVISSYLPYCDAMFVDDEFALLVQEEPLASEIAKYGTRVFSTRTRDEFLDYLKDMERAIPAVHSILVVETYGNSWLSGFRSILELHRKREATRKAGEQAVGTGGGPDETTQAG